MIKFTKSLNEYSYILSFDIAKKVTGYSLYDLQNDTVLLVGVIDTSKSKDELVWNYFYNEVVRVIKGCADIVGGERADRIFITKEKLPNQNGRFSTIETLQGLAQAHAIFDLAVRNSGVEAYDYEGVHSTSVKAYFKQLTDVEKPQKEDIAKYLIEKYPSFDFSPFPLDVTDSLGVTYTLIGKKWNADIKERIKEIKKDIKNAKSNGKVTKLTEEMAKLEQIMC